MRHYLYDNISRIEYIFFDCGEGKLQSYVTEYLINRYEKCFATATYARTEN